MLQKLGDILTFGTRLKLQRTVFDKIHLSIMDKEKAFISFGLRQLYINRESIRIKNPEIKNHPIKQKTSWKLGQEYYAQQDAKKLRNEYLVHNSKEEAIQKVIKAIQQRKILTTELPQEAQDYYETVVLKKQQMEQETKKETETLTPEEESVKIKEVRQERERMRQERNQILENTKQHLRNRDQSQDLKQDL